MEQTGNSISLCQLVPAEKAFVVVRLKKHKSDNQLVVRFLGEVESTPALLELSVSLEPSAGLGAEQDF